MTAVPADVPQILGGQMPVPLWWHPRVWRPAFDPALFQAASVPGPDGANRKPCGGLWSSPGVPDAVEPTSEFEAWLKRDRPRRAAREWGAKRRVDPHPLARVVVLVDPGHWDSLYAAFPGPGARLGPLVGYGVQEQYLDWAAFGAAADGLLLTGAALAWSNCALTSLAAWDMPTLYWMNRTFSIV